MTKKKVPEDKVYRKIESDTSGGLKTGSTRMRMFKALSRAEYPHSGMAVKDIKKATGMAERSGHLTDLLAQELLRGRVRRWTGYQGKNEVEVYVYCLTALGRRDFDAGKVDGSRLAGNRIGTKWPRKRKLAEAS